MKAIGAPLKQHRENPVSTASIPCSHLNGAGLADIRTSELPDALFDTLGTQPSFGVLVPRLLYGLSYGVQFLRVEEQNTS